MWVIWWASSNWTIIKITQEQLQSNCIHIFRDDIITDTTITMKCIRCWLQRIINK